MPYDLTTKSGVVLRNIPDDMDPNDPALRRLASREVNARNARKPPDPEEIARMASEGMNPLEKGLANIGAGMDSAWTGAKQLAGKVGIGSGVSDEDVQEKRRIDEGLADNTTGGKLLQIAGEALPTMVVPFGTAARVGGAGLRAVGAARAANAIGGGTARAVADNALMGAAGGALGPTTSDESRGMNAAIGAGFGAAIPGAASLYRGGKEALTRGGATNVAAREVQQALADNPNAGRDVAGYLMQQGQNPNRIPLSSAAVTQSPQLARMEAGARTRNGADFFEFDQNQGRRVSDAVMRDTGEAEQLAARRKTRGEEWDSNWNQAQEAAQPEVWAQRLPEFRQNLDVAMRSAEASNPAVRNVLTEVASEIDRLGPDFTPAHLQQIRANLNARGKAIPANAYQAAPRDSAAVSSLLREVDNVMNETTNGAWGGVTNAYATSSRGVDASKAAGRVRDTFVDAESGRVRGTALDPRGDVPLITEHGLGRAMDRAVGPDKVSQLSQGSQQGLAQTLEALRQQGIVQRVKKSATAGGGSNTASDTVTARALDTAGRWAEGVPLVGPMLSPILTRGSRIKEQTLAEALRDPAALQRLMTRAVRTPGELSPKEQMLIQALRQSGAVGASQALQAPSY